MATVDCDLMLRQISRIEDECFSDPWSLDSLWSAMGRDYNLIYFALGNEERYTIYSLRGGEEINVQCLETIENEELDPEKNPGDKLLMGYIIATDIADESELLRIAVADKFRRLDVGKSLMNYYKDNLKDHCDKFLLEVRESNQGARKLYEKMGYEVINTRKGYYSNPKEDACIYSLQLGPYYKLDNLQV